MGDAMELEAIAASPSSSSLDLHSFRSEVKELMESHRSILEDEPNTAIASSDSEMFVKDCALDFESKVKEIISDCSNLSFLGIEDLDAYLEHLKEELKSVEAESTRISNEIETLSRTQVEDSNRLESDLEELNCALDVIASQGSQIGKEDGQVVGSTPAEHQLDLIQIHEDHRFEYIPWI